LYDYTLYSYNNIMIVLNIYSWFLYSSVFVLVLEMTFTSTFKRTF
jgi:hypothetical protein